MFSSQGGNDPAECGLLSRQDGFQTGHRIHMQVETVSNVKCVGDSAPNRISKSLAAVARYDLHTWMLTEPGSHRVYLTVG